MSSISNFSAVVVLAGVALVVGCHRPEPNIVEAKPPEVLVALPTEETVTEFEEFTGRTMAVNTVEIRARVSGHLDKVFFTDGSDVKAGDPLFQIDPRWFKAEADQAAASVEQLKARLERLVRQEERARKLTASRSVTEEAFDQARFDRAEADASLAAAEAATALAQLNLEYTYVVSPITGRISRRLVDPGNLVKEDETPLATVVSQDPIYAYFDVDERTVLRLRRIAMDSGASNSASQLTNVQFALADEADFTIPGKINFFDNQVDPTTGTLRMRAVIANPKGFLSPGLFVRLRVPVGAPHEALLVREEALGTDQGQRFLYVVNDKNEVAYRRVKVGLLTNGRRVIESGLKPGERVVVTGLQRVRPGTKVIPKPADTASEIASTPTPAR